MDALRTSFKQGQNYDQNRPSYTNEVTLHVVENLYKRPYEGVQYNILELGAGTGKFTRKIQPHLEKDLSYLATDRSEQFLHVLKGKSPDVETQVFSANEIPLPDCSVQNIVCAQSMHFFANTQCLDEITRVLVPHGRLLCVWNHKDVTAPWVKEMEDLLRSYLPADKPPMAYLRAWHPVLEGYNGLRTVENCTLPGLPDLKGNKDFVVDHFTSISVPTSLDAQGNMEDRTQFMTVLDKHVTDDSDEINIPYITEYYCAEKV